MSIAHTCCRNSYVATTHTGPSLASSPTARTTPLSLPMSLNPSSSASVSSSAAPARVMSSSSAIPASAKQRPRAGAECAVRTWSPDVTTPSRSSALSPARAATTLTRGCAPAASEAVADEVDARQAQPRRLAAPPVRQHGAGASESPCPPERLDQAPHSRAARPRGAAARRQPRRLRLHRFRRGSRTGGR